MRLLDWLRGVSKRAISALPWNSGGSVASVVSAERAASLIPLFACVRILSDNIASLPIQAYRKLGDERQPMPSLPQLLQAPAIVDNTFQWIHKAVVSLAYRGNAYGLVMARDGFNSPTQIEWMHPDDVHVDESSAARPVYYRRGVRIPAGDVVHIPWMVMPGCVKGLSPIQAFAASIGVGLAATDYGRRWFDNGGVPPATMKNTQKTITAGQAEEIRDRVSASIRSGKPLVTGMDWEFSAISVNPEEAQFIETMQLNATQIAAIYGVPPEQVGGKSGGSLTYNSPEQNTNAMLTWTFRSWLVRFETYLSALLPERQFIKFNVDSMIRTDLLTRYQAHHIALTDGWKSKDEIRATEDLSPLPDGKGAGFAPPPAPPRVAPLAQPDQPPARSLPALDSNPGHTNGHHKEIQHV